MDRLAAGPGGYLHRRFTSTGTRHWMNKLDARPFPGWRNSENPYYLRIVWFQDDVLERQFYWLQVPAEFPVQERQKIVATVEGKPFASTETFWGFKSGFPTTCWIWMSPSPSGWEDAKPIRER